MTIINNSYGFIFVHIPKAAGTSITSILSKYTNYCDLEIGGTEFGERIQPAYRKRFGIGKHSTARDIRNIVGTVTWSKCFTFTFVRNPYSRCLSTYNFLRKWESPNEAFNKTMCGFSSFEEFVMSDLWEQTSGPDDIFRPQMFWLRANQPTNQLLVDFIGRVETINQDVETIYKTLSITKTNLETASVPNLNRSTPDSAIINWDAKVLEKIYDRYKLDFEYFGYSSDPTNLVATKY